MSLSGEDPSSAEGAGPASERPAYVPIACALHDHLESAATLRRTLQVAYRNESGEVKRVEGRIADVVARGGAEYAVLGGGQEVRLDRLLQVGEVSFAEEGGSC